MENIEKCGAEPPHEKSGCNLECRCILTHTLNVQPHTSDCGAMWFSNNFVYRCHGQKEEPEERKEVTEDKFDRLIDLLIQIRDAQIETNDILNNVISGRDSFSTYKSNT